MRELIINGMIQRGVLIIDPQTGGPCTIHPCFFFTSRMHHLSVLFRMCHLSVLFRMRHLSALFRMSHLSVLKN